MNSKIEISLSKTKIVWMTIGSGVFVVLGVLFIGNSQKFTFPIMRNPEVIRITGTAAVCFFGACLIFYVRKLFDNRPGLVIDEYGITDNTNATSVGLIEWSDITSIVKQQVLSTKFLIVHTRNPRKYIERAKNLISKKAMEINDKQYGSPITIISTSIKIDFDELERLIRSEFAKIQERMLSKNK